MTNAALAANSLTADIERGCASLTPQLIAWRRDLHAHPELGNREFRTAGIVAEHLRSLGLDDRLKIRVRGRQTHGAAPWRGVDPIVTAAQVVLGLQTIVSRQLDITHEPAVLTIGAIKGGVRENIIPDEVQMLGSIRAFDEKMREQIHTRVRETAEGIARSARAECEVCIRRGYDVTVNDAALTALMRPTLERVAGAGRMPAMPKVTGSEDFSCFQQVVPGMFFFVGVTPADKDAGTAEPNHSPRFYVDEQALPLGVRALAQLTCDYLEAPESLRRLD